MSDYTNPLFADRHIGPDSEAVAAMLEVIGVDSLEELARRALPAGILDELTDTGAAPGLDQLPPAATEAEALAELRALADANTVAVSMIGQGYYDTLHAAGAAPQHLGEPGLVHGLHAVPAGDQPGPAGSAAELPDHGGRPDRSRGGQRIDARRGHRGRRGDDADAPRRCKGNANRLAVDVDVFAQTAAVLATRAEPLGIEIVTADLRDGPAGRASSSASSLSCPAPAAGSPTGRRWSRRRTTAARWSPSAPTCWR